jgi:hypothetical protein
VPLSTNKQQHYFRFILPLLEPTKTMSDAGTIILEYVCPAVGVVLATQMFLAPYRDVQMAIKAGSLGELNPLPWVFM